ncbi:MAG: PAS domain S-box protein [Pseudomonadales bacterium]|jgi:PAS domain S-box-containing protein|nr:PAS domain S-box protein [Pseudomonadales bacterium]MDP6472411.1 PAS domain S-box protein [Pseudomonadales bacterium]MDP6828207.1 PAS domain S-box protein [Pseudomonadales bacterium]|tara:strand:+ start:1769 stop:2899 length:1131 start_codon:yes stop_codon:yes gene_type:complete
MTWGNLGTGELFDQLPDPALLIRVDGGIAAINPLAVALFEISTPAEPGNVLDLLTQPERARLDPLAWMEKWADTPDAPELDYVYLTCRTRAGNEKQLRIRVARIITTEPLYLIILRDVTLSEARLRTERKAHRTASRLLAMSADAVINVDAGMHVTWVNTATEKLFGYEPGKLIGQHLGKLLPGRFRTEHTEYMRRFAQEKASSRLMGERARVWGMTSGGEEVPLEASITRLHVDDEVVFSAQLRDLRPRLEGEAAVQESNAQFRELFEHVDQPMALLSADGTVIAMNPATHALLTADIDVIGQDFAGLPWWSSDGGSAREGLEDGLEECRQGRIFRITPTFEFDGKPVTLDVSMRPISRDGTVFSILAVAQPIDA